MSSPGATASLDSWELRAKGSTHEPQSRSPRGALERRRLTAESPAFEAAADDVNRRLDAIPAVTNLRSPLGQASSDQISADGRSAIVRFDIHGDPEKAVDKIDPVLAAVDEAKAAHPDLYTNNFPALPVRVGEHVVVRVSDRADPGIDEVLRLRP